jgi:hypothetical protein
MRASFRDNAAEPGYPEAARSLVFNTTVNEYALPVTVSANSAVTGAVRLLPVYTLDGVILPRKPRDISSGGGRKLAGAAALAGRGVAALRPVMTVLRRGRMLTKRASAEAAPESGSYSFGASPETGMTERAPAGETVLRYRDPAPQTPAPAAPTAAREPDMNELVRRFGNLIEGADAGLTPSFDAGTRGIGEAMAAIEETAEKVAVNSKLIEQIREKQREIETVTLKSSDIDAISEEMIRKLRSRMRLDRSRYAGQ